MYSYDGGETIYNVDLPETVFVSNLFVVSERSERFIVIAHDAAKRRKFFSLDFSKIHNRNCEGTLHDLLRIEFLQY